MDENPYKAPQEQGKDLTAAPWTKAARRIGFGLAILPWLVVATPGMKHVGDGVLFLIFRWGLEPTSIFAAVLCGIGMIYPPRRLAIFGLVSVGLFWGIFGLLVLRHS
jgi:hypothetical protein